MPPLSNRVNLYWLIRLRWAAIVGQLVTIVVSISLLAVHLPMTAMLGLLGLEALSNVVCVMRARAVLSVSQHLVGAVLALDILLFTGLLYLSGGPANPFSFLYLVYLAAAAMLLPPVWTWALAGLSLAGSAALFLDARPLVGGHSHGDHMRLHLQGMWVALGVATAFIAYFLMRVTRALSERECELAAAQLVAQRQQRFASLATLAAGAAHELATPLATIATVTKELERGPVVNGSPQAKEDVELIRSQVERCRTILNQMAADSGNVTGEAANRITVAALLDATIANARIAPAIERDVDCEDATLWVPVRAVTQALHGLVVNAQDSSVSAGNWGGAVMIRARACAAEIRIDVIDRGVGMSEQTLLRAGEPFFTTKEPGHGMGLGLFLTRTVIERIGGTLEITSALDVGTTVCVTLSTGDATTRRIGAATLTGYKSVRQ